MEIERLKKILAGLGVASLIAGSTLTFSGCPKDQPESSTGNGQNQEAGESSCSGTTSCSGSQEEGKSS